MSILDQLNNDMKDAMRAKERKRLTTIRMIKSTIQNEEIAKGSDLDEDEVLAVLSREKKQRLESLAEFEKADRDDLVQKIKVELEIVDQYLPEQLSEAEVKDLVQETITEVGAESMKDMGRVMSAVMPKILGKADGSLVSQYVKDILNSK